MYKLVLRRLKGAVLLFALWAVSPGNAGASQSHAPAPAAPPKELATYMGELQRLTHKLALAVDHQHSRLTAFYLHESLALLEEIQLALPEYEDQPVAVLIDRIALPAYGPLKDNVHNTEGYDAKAAQRQLTEVIDSCNACHQATHFEFIKITQTRHNPFNQDFEPQ